MNMRSVWAVALALLLAAALPALTAAAQPTVTAKVPAELRMVYAPVVPSYTTEAFKTYITLQRDAQALFTLIDSGAAQSVTAYIDGQPVAPSVPVLLKAGTHNLTVVVQTGSSIAFLSYYFSLYMNVTFPWQVAVDEDGSPVLDVELKHGVAVGGTSPSSYFFKVDLMGTRVSAVTADKGQWSSAGTVIYTNFDTLLDNFRVHVVFEKTPVSASLIRVVDNWGQPVKLPSALPRVIVGSQFTAQPLTTNLTVLHFVNGSKVGGFAFDRATLYKCALVAYRVYSKDYTYLIINATTFGITPEKLSVKYELQAPEALPFTVKLRGDLGKVGMYALDFLVQGTVIGTVTNTEKVYVDGNVTTIGTYTVSEAEGWYNVSITYPVQVYSLTHPFVSKVYTFEPVSVTTDKVYLTFSTAKPALLKSTRKVIRASGSTVGDVPVGSAGDVYFIGITKQDTYTVKLATTLTVRNTFEGKAIKATVKVYDSKGNLVAQGYGEAVTFELEPLNSYLVVGDNGAEKQSRNVYLTDDVEITFAYTTAPPIAIPVDYIYIALLTVIAAAIIYLVYKLRRGGIALEIRA
jgi:hypothetical protein